MPYIYQFWKRVRMASPLVRAASVLVGGSALSQAVALLALPVLTRLYTPADFSVLAVFTSAVMLLSVGAGLRLELAIPIPKEDEEGANLLAAAVILASSFSVVALLAIWFLPSPIKSSLASLELRPFLWLIPAGMWVTSIYTALQYWHTRRHNFKDIATTRITQSLTGTATQVGFGLLKISPLGLLLGQLINNGAGIVRLARKFHRQDGRILRSINLKAMKSAFRRHSDFPKYSMLEALANAASMQLPFVLIPALGTITDAGYMLLATRVMSGPMALIGMALSQVFFSRASDEYRGGRLGEFTGKMLSSLYKVGVGPIIFIGVTAPLLFPILFGPHWHRAGTIVLWMTPSFVLQFLVSPISMVPHVQGRLSLALWLQLLGVAVRVVAVAVVSTLGFSSYVVEAYAASSAVFYVIYLCVVLRLAGASMTRAEIRVGTCFCAAWTLVSLLACGLLTYF